MESKAMLFQGASITDCGRNREVSTSRGIGYPHLVSAHLMASEPCKYDCFNRGISGNRVVDLYARIKLDMINLKPDYMSMLVGINDVWHEYTRQNGVDAPKYERVYDMLLTEVKEALPQIKLIIMEPFVLHGSATNTDEEHPGRWEFFHAECKLRQAAAKRIAEKHGAVYVPLQEMFDKVSANTPEGYWLYDGVHPTPAGHELLKQRWLEAYEKIR